MTGPKGAVKAGTGAIVAPDVAGSLTGGAVVTTGIPPKDAGTVDSGSETVRKTGKNPKVVGETNCTAD